MTAAALRHLPEELRNCRVLDGTELLARDNEVPQEFKSLASYMEEDLARISAEFDESFLIPAALKFRWIASLDRGELHAIGRELARVLSQANKGLSGPDADSIARTILFEVMDNVRVHARDVGQPGGALLGAAYLSSRGASAEPSTELQLVIADSGIGLVSSLGPHFFPNSHDRFLPDAVREWPRGAKTVVWAFHPLSSSREVTHDEPPVRGLSRANHQVRYLGGSIRVRTQDLDVSWDFAANGSKPGYHVSHGALVPGTLIAVELPMASGRLLNATPASEAPRLPVPRTCVLTMADQAQMDARIAEALVDTELLQPIMIVLPGLTVEAQSDLRLSRTIGRISAFTVGHPTVVVLPDCPSGLVYSHLQALGEYIHSLEVGETAVGEATGNEAISFPDHSVMVLGADWNVTWFGRDAEVPTNVWHATREAGFAPIGLRLEPEEDSLRALRTELPAAFEGWITSGGLAVTRLSLTEGAAAWIRQKVTEAIDFAGPGVLRTDLLLPSLLTASRFVDLERLLGHLGVTGLTGRVMGQFAAEDLRAPISIVVALPDAPDPFVDAFCEAVAYDGRVLRLDPRMESWRLIPAPEVRDGKAVLLGSMRHGGESLRAVAEALMRWGTEPQLAVVVLDGSVSSNQSLAALDVDIPVNSLLHDPVPPAECTFEHLLALSKESEHPAIHYPLTEQEFSESLEGLGEGFALAHVERSEDRHLVGYYDLRALVSDEQNRRKLVELAAAKVIECCSDECPQHTVLFPGDDPGIAEAVAIDVAGCLPGAVARPIARVSGELADNGSDFLSSQHAVFVDWGVVTARTAREAISRMVAAGARQAQFIGIASQLDVESERHLNSLHTVWRPAPAPLGQLELVVSDLKHASDVSGRSSHDTSVSVSFSCLTRIPSTTYSHATCPLCLAVADFSTLARSAPTDFLRAHAERKVDRLRARPRSAALAWQGDLYGAVLDRNERSDLIRVWSKIERSRESVVARAELLIDLESMLDAGATGERWSVALCRILAARHDLLHSPPLSYSTFRRLVFDHALRLVVPNPGGQRTLSAPVVQQAVVVLRATSKQGFVDALPQIVGRNLRSRTVLGEALFGAYSILVRNYYPGPSTMAQLVSSLGEAEEMAERGLDGATADPDVLQTVRLLRRQAQLIRSRASASGPVDSWHALRHEYGAEVRDHHHAINRLGQIRRRLDDLVTEEALASSSVADRFAALERIGKLWDVCIDFFSANVLPYFRGVASPLTSEYYRDLVGSREQWRRWEDLVNSAEVDSTLEFGRLLSDLMRDPGAFDASSRAQLQTELEFLARFLLAIRSGGDGDVRHSNFLATWLEECPTDLATFRECIETELAGSEPAGTLRVAESMRQVGGRHRLFCPDGLLSEAASVVVENACSRSAGEPVLLEFCASERPDATNVVIRSLGTAFRSAEYRTGGGGIQGLRRRMGAFGVEVGTRRSGSDFETSFAFLKG